MTRPALYAAITNHGFGHATRSAAVLADVQEHCPDLHLIVVTTAPQWLLDSYLKPGYTYRPRVLDVGAVQSDSFTIDRDATLIALQTLQRQAPQLIQEEVQFIHDQDVSLVFGDVPPMAGYIAHSAGIPCWMSSNFGWDLIYQEWGDSFKDSVDWVQRGFAHCDRLFRLPFHEAMPAFPLVEEVGLTGARPRLTEAELRAKFSLKIPRDRIVMFTFGGYGISHLPYSNITQFSDWQFITFDAQAPNNLPNLLKLDGRAIRPVDVMPLCGQIIGKPGYGTFAEALLQEVPIISLPRSGFAEAEYLLKGLQDYSYHQILKPGEFETSQWEFLRLPLTPPRSTLHLAKTGNYDIVNAIAKLLG